MRCSRRLTRPAVWLAPNPCPPQARLSAGVRQRIKPSAERPAPIVYRARSAVYSRATPIHRQPIASLIGYISGKRKDGLSSKTFSSHLYRARRNASYTAMTMNQVTVGETKPQPSSVEIAGELELNRFQEHSTTAARTSG